MLAEEALALKDTGVEPNKKSMKAKVASFALAATIMTGGALATPTAAMAADIPAATGVPAIASVADAGIRPMDDPVATPTPGNSDVGSQNKSANSLLYTAADNAVKENNYQLKDGGTLRGSSLFDKDTGKIKSATYEALSSREQSRFISDLVAGSEVAVKDEKNGVTAAVQANWLRQLQAQPGVGSKLLNEVLKNTRPDFVTANRIYAPFSGIVGTILGLLAILLMAFLGIVMVLDISYIALPPMRMLVNTEGGKGGGSKIISNEAISAVREAEEQSEGKTGKAALGIYLKRRIIMLILLGICLLYLVQGQIYVAVGWIMDLVSGFLGF